MKQTKKLLAILLLAATSICVGCNGQPKANEKVTVEQTTTEATAAATSSEANAETSNGKIEAGETFEGEGFTFTAPKDWKKMEPAVMEGAITVYKDDTQSINVVMTEAGQFKGMSMEDYKKSIEQNFEAQKELGIIVDKLELKTMPYGDVVYVEASTKMTKELIDKSISSGALTQETVDAIGGVEEYIKNMSLGQVYIFHLKDDKLFMITAQSLSGSASDVSEPALFVAENTKFN